MVQVGAVERGAAVGTRPQGTVWGGAVRVGGALGGRPDLAADTAALAPCVAPQRAKSKLVLEHVVVRKMKDGGGSKTKADRQLDQAELQVGDSCCCCRWVQESAARRWLTARQRRLLLQGASLGTPTCWWA